MHRRSLPQRRAASAAGAELLTDSTVAVTNSPQSGVYREIHADRTLRYLGPDETDEQSFLKAATKTFVASKRHGDGSFRPSDERDHVVSGATGSATTPSVTGSPRAHSVSSCAGERRHDTQTASEGLRHDSSLDDCQCNTPDETFEHGAFYSDVLAFFAKTFQSPAAAAVPGATAILKATQREIEDTNDGWRIVIRKYLPEIDPSHLSSGSGTHPQQ